MQKTRFRDFINYLINYLNPLISDTWRKRSISLLSLLSGFYCTNSFISYLLDKAFNTVFLAIFIVLIMELSIRSLLLSKKARISILLLIINNIRIGSSYALILEAFKLGS